MDISDLNSRTTCHATHDEFIINRQGAKEEFTKVKV